MTSKYTELFNNITPPKSDDELLRNVLSCRGEAVPARFSGTTKKRYFRRPVIIAAAAVAAASVGVTAAGASVGWDFTKLFRGFYSQRALDNAGYIDTGIENQLATADLSAMGTDLYQTADFGFGKVTFTGAVADSSVIMVMYELDINEDVLHDFAQDYGLQENEIWGELEPDSQTIGFYGTQGFGERTKSSYKRTVIFEFHGNELNKESSFNASFCTLSLWGNSFTLEIPLEEPVTIELSLDFISTERVTVETDAEVQIDNYLYELKKVNITPLAVQLDVKEIRKTGKPDKSEPLILQFKDGTEVKNYSLISSTVEGIDSYPFLILLDKPIDINNLSSVTIGDYTLYLE